MVHKLSLLICLCFAVTVHAQQYTTSPFSTQGLGESGGLDDPQFGGIGHCRTAAGDSISVNLYNPSSYPMLVKGLPLFAIGMSGRFSEYSSNDGTANGRIIGLNQISMVLPLGNRFGMAVGLQPFSRKGYNIEDKEVLDTQDTMRYTYIGSGTTQQVTGGLGYKVIDLKRSKFYVGANYSYIFGSVTNERRSELTEDAPVGGVDQKTYRVHGAQYSIGLTYNQMLDTMDRQHLAISAVLTPQQKLGAHRDYFLFFSKDVSDPNVYDTLAYTVDDKGTIVYPASMSFGFNYSIRPKRDADYKLKTIWQLNILGDYTSTMWSTYKTDFNTEHESQSLANSNRFSLGLQFTPNYESNIKSIGTSYLNRVRYRAGAYYGQLPNIENGQQLTEMGVTLGFGLPIALQKTNSSFNFSFQYGQRGNDQPDGLQERYFGVSLGVILAPSRSDMWFRKFKVD